jgi:four helix bundle protein
MKNPVLKNKSFEFGVMIVAFCQQLSKEKKEYVLSKQLLRAGTSVGALIREAEYAQSRADFICKMNISLKEANEVEYWLDLLAATGYLDKEHYSNLSEKIKELLRMLIASIKTARQNSVQ